MIRLEMENYSMILIEKRPKYLLYHQVVGNCARFQQKKSRKITRNFTISFHCKRTIATELNLQKQHIKHTKIWSFLLPTVPFLAVFQQ